MSDVIDPFRVKRRSDKDPKPLPPINNPFALMDEQADFDVSSATREIYKYLNVAQGRSKDTNVNRCSAATMCVKRRWYQHHGYDGEPLAPRKLINFMLGDLTEMVLLNLIVRANVGEGKLYSEVDLGKVSGTFICGGHEYTNYKQQDLSFKLLGRDVTITGHADGFGRRNCDGKWELIECKSASSPGFAMFVKEGPKDYLKQAHALMLTDRAVELAVKSVRFFYIRKETGHPADRSYDWDSELAASVIEDFSTAITLAEPKAPYEKSTTTNGRFTIVMPCTYCPYIRRCHGEYTKEWKTGQYGTMKPLFYFKS